jgi:hypothetical protein
MVQAEGEDGHAAIIKFDGFSTTCANLSGLSGLDPDQAATMGPLDALWHLLNLFAPALGVGLLASSVTKLLWRRELAAVPLRRLAAWACGTSAIVTLAGLVILGRDGRMATYGAMIVGCALALWWAGFVRRR